MSLRVALRADASARIGYGHVRRCLSLASALQRVGVETQLVSRMLGVDVASLATDSGVSHVMLHGTDPSPVTDARVTHAGWAEVGWQRDSAETVHALESWRPDWVIVDHYAFDERWHREVAKRLGARLGGIDDLADRDLAVDMLIDHNLSEDHRSKYASHLPPSAAVLGGPRYALLGPAFATAPRASIRPEVRSIGIFMGGIDAANLSSVALRACREHTGFTGRIEIVVTNASPHAESIRLLAAGWPDTLVLQDLPDLAEFFARHDMQVGAGGGASWERCCIGAPTLALRAALNQDAVLPALARVGAIELAEAEETTDASRLGARLRVLIADEARRRELGVRSQALVDGYGALRVALRVNASSLSLRPANLEDAERMYEWRNAPATREASLDSRTIAWDDHLRWLEASVANSARHLLIASVGGVDVGVLRFDRDEIARYAVSLYLDPRFQGLGLGGAMLLEGERYLARREPGAVSEFLAVVRPENRASVRLFEGCGYRLSQGIWHKHPQLDERDEFQRGQRS